MFDQKKFFESLAKELIFHYENASLATTPGLIGGAREQLLKDKIGQLLPSFVEVSSGCVIDSYGGTSKQTDVIIYEKDLCPKFIINNTPEATYFPCEGVVAIGEVKSSLGKKELLDSIEKIKSVRQLRRHTEDSLKWRQYGSVASIHGTESERFDQDKNAKDQIFGFVFCKKITLKIDSFLAEYASQIQLNDRKDLPNILVSLEDGIFIYLNDSKTDVALSAFTAKSLYNIKAPEGDFQYLLNKLHQACTTGRSTNQLPFSRYIMKNSTIPGGGRFIDL